MMMRIPGLHKTCLCTLLLLGGALLILPYVRIVTSHTIAYTGGTYARAYTSCMPEQSGPSARPTIPPLEELERQTEEAFSGRQSAAGSQAGPSVPNPRRQAQLAAETIQTLRENVSMLSEVSERAGSVASSSHRRSHQAMQLLERERQMRELERQKFDAEISLLKAALKEQMDVSQEAVSSMQQVKEELRASREESRKWQEELRHSRFMSHE